ncbi:DUF2278 family protein [Allocoleopsis franciscana]|uniref:LTD domain-containing protein n=1 Tax=Allocoleopsis franciscana PCC 7113 TaxID=1173027 RepID=K9WEQ5_9CYAN|nr:DUF2278 family protein [Allocoleopsis franciscana]AFZ18890.1 hypothetical protein Mic7113_3147 [Allocoleopsis franciscana PCC 7113]
MPIKNYGVLKGRAVAGKMENDDKSPHYQVHVKDNQQSYRLAINVQSVLAPVDLLYFVDDDFDHSITDKLTALDLGFHLLPSKPGELALDYIRGNLFDVTQMKPLPYNVPGPDNDLNELIDLYIQRAIKSDKAVVYAFGEKWGPETKADKIFGFRPGNGVHDIHMNQGSSGTFQKYNGVYQDGGLLIHFPERNQWVAAFFAFQSQSFHTDDVKGNPLVTTPDKPPLPLDPTTPTVAAQVRIIAALVNPMGEDPGKESVTLLNASPAPVDLTGWALADRLKRKYTLTGIIESGACMRVPLSGTDVQLANDGGIITLLDAQGIKIDGVSYTKEEAKKQGWTIVF